MKLKVVIDRFEGDKAVLLFEKSEDAVNWPRKILPSEVNEGDILCVQIERDAEATRSAQIESEQLLRQVIERNREG